MNEQLQEIESNRIKVRHGTMIEKARSGLLAFTTYTKSDYEINWHHRLVANHLNRFLRKEIMFLMIWLPPRIGKSELCSRRLPAFYHGKFPDNNIMAASYSSSLANDMTSDVQRIMDSIEYRQVFPDTIIPFADERDPIYHRNSEGHAIKNHRGKYMGQGVGGSFTGKGAHLIVIDDPIKSRKEADSATYRESVWKWYTNDLTTRLEKGGQILLVATRWHEDDLSGRILKLMQENPQAPQFKVLKLAAIREDMDFQEDPRQLGEALWPNKYPIESLRAQQALDSRGFTALYQQRPTALEGGVVKASWLQFYKQLPEKFDRMILSLDATFKDKPDSDYVALQAWGQIGSKKYLVDQIRDRLGFTDTCSAVRILCARYPQIYIKLIEDAANGPAIIETLVKQGVGGIVPIRAKDSKYSRLYACSPQFEAGDVFYPDPSIAPWINTNVDEILNFPNLANDDTVDATSQALNYLQGKVTGAPKIWTV